MRRSKVVRLNGIIEDSRIQAEALENRIKSEIDTNSELKCHYHEIEAQLYGEKIKRENIESEMKNIHEIRKMFTELMSPELLKGVIVDI